jgi:hypothetical protein
LAINNLRDLPDDLLDYTPQLNQFLYQYNLEAKIDPRRMLSNSLQLAFL